MCNQWNVRCLGLLSAFLLHLISHSVQNICKAGLCVRPPEKTPTKMNFAMNQSYLYEYTLSEIFLAVEEKVGESLCKREVESPFFGALGSI